jgi:hypothetical protein
MKPAGTGTGYVDGGWWPRSTEPADEFPGLVETLRAHVGQVSRLAYNLDFWAPVHRKLTVAGRAVRCEGFHTMDPHTVTAIGTDSRRVTLLVVPPDKPADAAEAALRTASDSNGITTVEDLLAGNGDRTPRRAGAATQSTR